MGDDGVGVAGVAPPHRADAGGEFGEVEGLHQIVVGAGVQAVDAVRHLIECREDDDGCYLAAAAQCLEEGEAEAVGQHEVEQHQVEGGAGQRIARHVEAHHPVDRMAVGGDLVTDGGAQYGVVLDQQDSHGAPFACAQP